MTLDEAIKHCEYVAEGNERHVKYAPTETAQDCERKENCQKCADDHRQLAKWLRELKDRRSGNVIPVSWIEGRIKWLKDQDFELAHLSAGIVQATLNEWEQEVKKK